MIFCILQIGLHGHELMIFQDRSINFSLRIPQQWLGWIGV